MKKTFAPKSFKAKTFACRTLTCILSIGPKGAPVFKRPEDAERTYRRLARR